MIVRQTTVRSIEKPDSPLVIGGVGFGIVSVNPKRIFVIIKRRLMKGRPAAWSTDRQTDRQFKVSNNRYPYMCTLIWAFEHQIDLFDIDIANFLSLPHLGLLHHILGLWSYGPYFFIYGEIVPPIM